MYFINQRILADNKIYIQLSVCAKVLGTTEKKFRQYCKDIRNLSGIGECITETEFNTVLTEHYPDAEVGYQYTRADTLDIERRDLMRLTPLKRMFAEPMLKTMANAQHMTVEEYILKTEIPGEIEKVKARIMSKRTMKEQLEEQCRQLRETENTLPLERAGLRLQTMAVLKPEYIDFTTFLAGKGVFMQVDLTYIMSELQWNDMYMDSEYTLIIPGYDEDMEIDYSEPRDFREFSVIQNMEWVMTNISPVSEWTDTLTFRKHGIDIEIPINILAKYINPASFPEHTVFAVGNSTY